MIRWVPLSLPRLLCQILFYPFMVFKIAFSFVWCAVEFYFKTPMAAEKEWYLPVNGDIVSWTFTTSLYG